MVSDKAFLTLNERKYIEKVMNQGVQGGPIITCIHSRQGEIFLGLENGVQFQGWKLGAHDIVDVRGDLLLRVRKRIKRLVNFLPDHLVLDADHCSQKHVVLCLGLDTDVKLLDTKGDLPRFLFARANDDAQPGGDQAVKLPETFDDDDFGCRYADAAWNTHGFWNSNPKMKVMTRREGAAAAVKK